MKIKTSLHIFLHSLLPPMIDQVFILHGHFTYCTEMTVWFRLNKMFWGILSYSRTKKYGPSTQTKLRDSGESHKFLVMKTNKIGVSEKQ